MMLSSSQINCNAHVWLAKRVAIVATIFIATRSVANASLVPSISLLSNHNASALLEISTGSSLRRRTRGEDASDFQQQQRNLQGDSSFYQTIGSGALGSQNFMMSVGNPMKGLAGNPDNASLEKWPARLGTTLQLYKRPLDNIILFDPDNTPPGKNTYDWSSIDEMIENANAYQHHIIIRLFIHWPGRPLALPDFLQNKIDLVRYHSDIIPYYGDATLRRVLKSFIVAFGRRYDGNTRIYSIQAGLIGSWGEWHTVGCSFKGEPCLPDYVKDELTQWYAQAFRKTKIQVRYPDNVLAFSNGMGFHDDSFTYTTVGGVYNGGLDKNAIFWTMANAFNTSTFWQNSPMGGEFRPDNAVNIFRPGAYKAGTQYKQDFMVCVRITHSSYVAWIRGYVSGGVGPSPEEENARVASSRLGYNFMIDKIGLYKNSKGNTDMYVYMRQIGVAPFYYDFALHLLCGAEGYAISHARTGIPKSVLLTEGDTYVAVLSDIPAQSCSNTDVELQLKSPYLYDERPIRWAQGTGRVILRNIPFQGDNGSPPPPPPPLPTPVPPPVSIPTTVVLDQRPQPKPSPSIPIPSKPKPKPNPSPYGPKPSPLKSRIPNNEFGIIGNCYLVCAAQGQCPNRAARGKDVGIMFSKEVKEFSLYKVGNALTLRCNVGQNNKNPNLVIKKVVYTWPTDRQSTVTKLPYAMQGNFGTVPVNYLSYKGGKRVNVVAYDGNNVAIGKRTILFKLID